MKIAGYRNERKRDFSFLLRLEAEDKTYWRVKLNQPDLTRRTCERRENTSCSDLSLFQEYFLLRPKGS